MKESASTYHHKTKNSNSHTNLLFFFFIACMTIHSKSTRKSESGVNQSVSHHISKQMAGEDDDDNALLQCSFEPNLLHQEEEGSTSMNRIIIE